MGGGDFTVPVQRVTDFLESKLSGKQPVSFILSSHYIVLSCGLFLCDLVKLVLLKQKHLCLHQAID